MKTTAVRLYGKGDLRLEEFELPALKDDELLARVITDSVCMSTYKAQSLGADHARVPDDVATDPTIVGHEMCGEIIEVGKNLTGKFIKGEKFVIQPALPDAALYTIGYSYHYCGGDATYVIIPKKYIDCGCVLPYTRDDFFSGSLAEPMSCIIGGFHVNYHNNFTDHTHVMGIVEGGACAILAGVGPMGLGAIDYALHCDRKPGLLVVTDIDDDRLARAQKIFTAEEAEKEGVKLVFINTAEDKKAEEEMLALTSGKGFDDVFVYAPVRPVVEMGVRILAKDGCLNFFAGPTDKQFSAMFNFYDVHYKFIHVAGNSGGNTADMLECLDMASKGRLNPAVMVTHVGGLDSAAETTINLPHIKGGKKLVYPQISMPMTAIEDFAALGKTDPFFAELARLTDKTNGLWNGEAEKYLLAHAKPIRRE